jgi:hypothetical protein
MINHNEQSDLGREACRVGNGGVTESERGAHVERTQVVSELQGTGGGGGLSYGWRV